MSPRVVKWPPILSTMGSGKRYAISGDVWIEVPSDTTRADLSKYMVCEPRTGPVVASDEVWEVQGSKGSKYAVRLSGGVWSCSCPGYSFRRKCRHIEEKKREI